MKRRVSIIILTILVFTLFSCDSGSSTAAGSRKISIVNIEFAGGTATEMVKKKNFKAGENIWILFQVKNYSKRPRGGESIEIWVREQIRITDPAGQVILLKYDFFDFHKVYPKDIGEPIPIKNSIQLPESVAKGNYTVKIQVLDYVGLDAAQASDIFAIQ